MTTAAVGKTVQLTMGGRTSVKDCHAGRGKLERVFNSLEGSRSGCDVCREGGNSPQTCAWEVSGIHMERVFFLRSFFCVLRGTQRTAGAQVHGIRTTLGQHCIAECRLAL